jgi:hypothetical protein
MVIAALPSHIGGKMTIQERLPLSGGVVGFRRQSMNIGPRLRGTSARANSGIKLVRGDCISRYNGRPAMLV